MMKKYLSIILTTAMFVMLFAGCGKTNGKTIPAPPYFTKGVFLNTEEGQTESDHKYYYVFDSETEGHTDGGLTGVPFACEQRDDGVWFSFGGMDPESEDFLTIESVEKGIIKGHFKDGKAQEFSPVSDVDPETFDAANYQNAAAGEDLIYRDANGWSARYDPGLFTVNGGGPAVSFVYTGESAGTNMITASYNVDKDAKTAIADLAKEWGDQATTSEGIFPGTDDVTGYWATLPPENEGSGLYSTAIARDYMQGYLLFELTGHNSGDEEIDMAVSDALAAIIDSLEFETYEDKLVYSDDASDFVLVSEAVPDVILEIRYYSTYNFVGDKIAGYEEPVALLTREAATALNEVSNDLRAKGYRLKIFDAYRPQRAVDNFISWAQDPDDIRMKEYFYPELDKDVLFPQGYIMAHSGHSRGSTVDLTLFDMKTEKEVDMGGTFDYFGELSHPDYRDITEEQYENRMILRDAMLSHGFKPLDEEWWHFTLENEPYPNTYFTFPVSTQSVRNTVSARDTSYNSQVAELEYWSEDSVAASSIRDYVARVTDKDSESFIPVEDRIAVFDLDGTIIGELYPSYFEYMMFIHRALHDDTYDAPEDMREFAEALEKGVYDGNKPDNHERLHAKYAGQAYAGMTPDELKDYTRKYMESEADGFKNLTRGEAFYWPMVSLVKYLDANDFTVYIVSGSDRTVVRALVKDKLGIPENRVIGMSYTMVADNQDGTDGLEYVYTKDDNVILGGDLIIKTIKMNKVSAIAEEIGKVPVLSFGNTAGDQSMAQYTVNNDQYETKAYMLMCDDLEREHGNMKKADAMKQMCDECGFEPISMRDDFATIYGDDVEVVDYEELEMDEALEPAA